MNSGTQSCVPTKIARRRYHRTQLPIGLILLATFLIGYIPPIEMQDTFGYHCEESKCVYTPKKPQFTDISSCINACGISHIQSLGFTLSDLPSMEIDSSANGTCRHCALTATTKYNFPRLFSDLDLTYDSLRQSSCVFDSSIALDMPSQWGPTDTEVTCSIGSVNVPCVYGNNVSTFTMSVDALRLLIESRQQYNFQVKSISTRSNPGSFSEQNQLIFKFQGVGCFDTLQSKMPAAKQAFQITLTSSSYKLIGTFTNVKVIADNLEMMRPTTISLSFRSGSSLYPGAFFLLRVAQNLESTFSPLIRSIDSATLFFPAQKSIQSVDLDLRVGYANISFTIPTQQNISIDNGDRLKIQFKHFMNPSKQFDQIDTVYLAAYQGLSLAVDNTAFPFFSVNKAQRAIKISPLDVISIVVYGFCFLSSLVIIKWHGLPLTMSTLWTDMVAISALFSFAVACAGSLLWVIQPSKLYVYWFAAQYFFNTVMILSLCFHWATVLSFRGFKKLTIKSPVVLAYFIVNGVILACLIVTMGMIHDKLYCVYDIETLRCDSVEECQIPLAAGGKTVRQSVIQCQMQFFYLLLGAGFIVYTVLLMILGCMVMSRGRHLMLNEDPSESQIRKSLAIFYSIIATTCVLYISAQVIYIAQYVSFQGEHSELSDVVWYIFISWLPQGLPPLLLLFLQWNPQTEAIHNETRNSVARISVKADVFNLTPRSSVASPNTHHYAKLQSNRLSISESILGSDDPSTKLRLIVRVKLPAEFDRTCFVSLDFFTSRRPLPASISLQTIEQNVPWICVGSTERVSAQTQQHAVFPFVAVLEVPVVGPASNTLLHFMVHASTIQSRKKRLETSSLSADYLESDVNSMDTKDAVSYEMTLFQPVLEFVTSSQAVLDAAASSQPLHVYPHDENLSNVMGKDNKLLQEMNAILKGDKRNAELSVQTVMMPGDVHVKDDMLAHKSIGNLIRFFQYDSDDGIGGLVVEDLQESTYANCIPRQLLEILAVQRHEQAEKAREELRSFLNQKKDKQARGFYGTLIGQIQDEGDTALAKEWLENRVKKRKEYVSALRKNVQLLVGRDKHKQYFKASVEKKNEDLRFVPINLHIQDLLIGPTSAFLNEEKRRSSKDITVYDFTTVGAFAAHCYKFNKGGIMSFQARLLKMQEKMAHSELDRAKWPEELQQYDDLQWDLQLRMDCCFAQALAALTASFVRKVEVAIQSFDADAGVHVLRMLSKLGFLFQVESLLSTHGKEIGMIEDMAGAIANLSCVSFVIQDVRDRPTGRFSFRVSRRVKDPNEDAGIVKVQVSSQPSSDAKYPMKYVVTVQVVTGLVELPERLANGGEISVIPLLFTQGINEMQTIANNTERAKTELQDMINMNNLKPLRAYCERYCRLAVALSDSTHSFARLNRNGSKLSLQLTKDQVAQEFHALEAYVLDAAQSLVKTKRPEILQKSSDLCRELGGGRVTVCKSAKDRTAMSVTLEQVRILHRHHDLPEHRIPATVSVMRSHGVRIENALKNTGKRQFAFNKLQRSLLPEEYRCPDQLGGVGNVS
ncbi:unnamed protein product [Albugo candida]|uniref:Inositol3 n=2 Tax=Albugo candida TaxID=65357 RepID=A0A024GKW0_9STRA|nr:unnamed protein product [Albugo candida]|eukprot:CCI47516.1 unnamed protein product [Albugo candida]